MANKQVGADISLRAKDLSGLKAVEDFDAGVRQAKADIEAIKANGGIAGIAVGAEEIDLATAKLDAMAAQLVLTQRELTNTQLRMSDIDANDAEFDQLTAKAAKLKAELIDLNRRAAETPQQLGRDFDIGRIGSTFSPLGGALSTATGSSAVGGVFQLAGDFSDLAEYMPGFQQNIKSLVDTFKAGRESSGSFTGGLGALTGAIGQGTVIVGLAAAATAVWSQAANMINEEYTEGREAASRYNDAIVRQIELQRIIAGLIEGGELDEAQRNYDDAIRRREDALQHIADLENMVAENDQAYADLGASFDPQQRNNLKGIGEGLIQAIQDAYINELGTALDDIQAYMEAFPEIEAASEAREAMQARADALQQQAQMELRSAELIRNSSTQEIRARQESIAEQRSATEAQIASLRELNDTTGIAADEIARLEGELAGLDADSALLDGVLPVIEAREAEAESAQNQLDAITAQIEGQQQLTELMRNATVEQLEMRREQIAGEIAAIESLLPELEALAETSDAAKQQLAQVRGEMEQFNTELANIDAAMPSVELREVQQGLEELADAEAATDEKITRLRAAANAKLVELEEALGKAQLKAISERDKAIAGVVDKVNKSIAELNADYMRSERKALEAHIREEKKITDKQKTERIRALEDLHMTLLEAEEDNNVVAFIRAQRQGEVDAKRQLEDQTTEARERNETYQRERREAEAERELRIQQLHQQAKDEREAIYARYEEQKALALAQYEEQKQRQQDQLTAQIAAEEAALLETVGKIKERYGLEDAIIANFFIARKKRYEAEDAFLNEQAEAALDNHISRSKTMATNDINTARQVANAKAQSEINAAQQVAKGVQSYFGSVLNYIAQRAQQVINAVAATRMPTGYGQQPYEFAEGGIAKAGHEILARFEGNRTYDEAIIPLEPNRLQKLFGGVMNGTTLQITGPITVNGEGITVEEATEAIYDMGYAILDGFLEARTGAN